MSPFVVLGIGVLFVIVAIAGFKAHPFFALILAAVLVGVLSPAPAPEPGMATEAVDAGAAHGFRESIVAWLEQARRAFEKTATGFGSTAASIGIVIALAAIIGQCLMESGAADKITRRLLALVGERRANYALVGSGYFLSVPVFFDTVFFLLVPLARAMRMRTGRHYLAYVMAICAGGAVTHSLVPPTPGPLFMAAELGVDLGLAIFGGFLLGLPVAFIGGIVLPRILERRMDIPLRDATGSSAADLEAIVARSERELPGFLWSVLPVALPVVLITADSIVGAVESSFAEGGAYASYAGAYGFVAAVTGVLGEKHFAMIAATLIALALLKRQRRYGLRDLASAVEPALMAAGVIILITSAGGAFGFMLRETGIATAIREIVERQGQGAATADATWSLGIILLLIAWGVAVLLKIAQGSGTVAIMTASSTMAAVLGGLAEQGIELPYHKIYIFAAIAFGSKVISWMNDSGFWVVSKMSGFTQEEALKTWTFQLGLMGILGLIEVLVLVHLLPLA